MAKEIGRQWAGYLQEARTVALVALAASVPLPFAIALNGGLTITTLSLSLFILIARWLTGIPRQPARYGIIGLEAALFVLYVLSLLWIRFEWAAPFLDKRLPLIAFPVLVLFAPLTSRERDLTLFSFTVTVTLLGLVGEALALVQYARTGLSHVFFANGLVYPFDLHRVYMSLHALFALCALLLAGKHWAPPLWRNVWMAGLLLLVLLLASRNTTLTLVCLGMVYVASLVWRGRRRLALGVAGTLGAGLAIALAVPQVRGILAAFKLWRTDWGTPETVDPFDGWQVRHFLWQSALEAGQAMPWYGYGAGTARLDLVDINKAKHFTYALAEVLNCHNQYLETWLDLGYPGLLLLAGLLLAMLIQGIRRNRLLAALALLSMLVFVTESYLEAQKGIAFFGLMWALVASAKEPKGQPQ